MDKVENKIKQVRAKAKDLCTSCGKLCLLERTYPHVNEFSF